MKNRRTVILSFIICACLCIGVGFAALTDTLEIKGTAEVSLSAVNETFNEDVYFTAAELANDTGDAAKDSASINSTDNDIANFNVTSLKDKDQYVQFKYTIANDGTLDALVTPSLVANTTAHPYTTDYFEITSDWNSTAKTIPAGSSIDITVKVLLKKLPTDTALASISGSWSIILNATSVDA